MAKGLPVVGVDPESTIQANAAVIIPVRIAELLQWERFIDDPRRVAELHAMRIAAKRLRYTMELFAPFYDAAFTAAIDRVKGIQEQLGSIHDADVLVPELLGQLRRMLPKAGSEKAASGVYAVDIDAAVGLLTLCQRKREEREAIYRKFVSGWRKLREAGFFEMLRAMVRREPPEPACPKVDGQ